MRNKIDIHGIFGQLKMDQNSLIALTLEHAFPTVSNGNEPGGFSPIIPPGSYLCIQGQHQLAGMAHSFTTFEITGVPGHTGLLFHSGNTESDTKGCVLLGETIKGNAIANSKIAFERFMKIMGPIKSFYLHIL